jgi:hypothetical protein
VWSLDHIDDLTGNASAGGEYEANEMISTNRQARTAHAHIETFGPMPTARQQVITLAVAATVMVLISATMAYLGLI